MLGKISPAAIFFLSTTPCFAGFYAGASMGPEGASFKQRSHVTRLGTFDVIDTNHFAGTGMFASVFGGYSLIINHFYVAGEVNANLSSVQYDLINKEYIHQTVSKTYFKVKSSESVSILPGYMLASNTVLYGRLGYANGRVKIVEADPTIHSQAKNRNGFRYGLGLRHALTAKLAFMLDYSQINYTSLKSSVFEPFGMVAKTTKISPNTAQVGFGLIYNFDGPPNP
ncbi:outer membrane protein [Legionella septentrionalis]|uniref:outer membrane protein n=1 Tax=Legionella septentrionalis TaxID=2498109 RepID=UPI000F8E5D79|nr:outer membrane beta-barrel protein [Legionella septentrionalis]RUR15252.1 porin family protein [Legionella septentrionalis]